MTDGYIPMLITIAGGVGVLLWQAAAAIPLSIADVGYLLVGVMWSG